MSSRKCDKCEIDVHRASYANHLKSKKQLEKIKQIELISPELLFREPIKFLKKHTILQLYGT